MNKSITKVIRMRGMWWQALRNVYKGTNSYIIVAALKGNPAVKKEMEKLSGRIEA